MITSSKNYTVQYLKSNTPGQLKIAYQQLENYFKDVKRLTSIDLHGGVVGEATPANPQNILTLRPLKQLSQRVNRVSNALQNIITTESTRINNRGTVRCFGGAYTILDLIHSRIKEALESGRDKSASVKSFTELLPGNLFGKVIDLLLRTLTHLIKLKNINGFKIAPLSNSVFSTLINNLENTLALCFETLSESEKKQLQDFSIEAGTPLNDRILGFKAAVGVQLAKAG